MRLKCEFLYILAFALSCVEAKPGTGDTVNIIQKFTSDLRSSPSGYIFRRHSNSIHPGGYNSDVNHGKTKIAGQLEMEKLAQMNNQGTLGTYKVAGGYGFTISHDYGSQRSHTEPPLADIYSPGNADLESIAVLQLGSEDTDGRRIDFNEKGESDGTEKSRELDGYIGKEIYGSHMEYDKLVKDDEKAPSAHPGEYYESDVHDGREKHYSDDGYDESNKGSDTRRYPESEEYYGPQDYKENEDHGARRSHDDYIDDEQTDKADVSKEHSWLDDSNDKETYETDEGYGDSSNYEPLETNDRYTNRDESYEAPSMYVHFDGYNTGPNFGDMGSSFFADLFKEYNEFSNGAHIQAGFDDHHEFDDGDYGHHDVEDEHSSDGENDKSGEESFDESDSHGDHREEEDGEKSINFMEKGGHKKGSKTTGFRNVLHKDEYTKDHTFYEHAKNNGHFDKDKDYNEQDHENEGSYEKTGHHDSSSDSDHHGKSDSQDKGHSFYDDLSDHDENDYKSYFDDHSDYGNGADGRFESEYEKSYEPNY